MLTFNKESFCLWLLFVLFVCNRLLINQKLKKILKRDKKWSTRSVILNFIFLYYNITRQIRPFAAHTYPDFMGVPITLLREARQNKPYVERIGSKEAAQKWSEIAAAINLHANSTSL